MRCKTCHYSLLNLTEHRCPECGNAFDPNDPNTFDLPEKLWTGSRMRHMVGATVLYGLLAIFVLMGAMAFLGAINHRSPEVTAFVVAFIGVGLTACAYVRSIRSIR